MQRRFLWRLLSHRRRGAGPFVAFVLLAFVRFRCIERPVDARTLVRNPFIANVAIVGGLLSVAMAGADRLAFLDIERP